MNNSTTPSLWTVLDSARQLPLPLASILVTSSDTTYSGTSVQSNYNGQFLTDAPIGTDNTVTITDGAYIGNATKVAIAANQTVVKRSINLTGVGVLAGTVISYPSLQPGAVRLRVHVPVFGELVVQHRRMLLDDRERVGGLLGRLLPGPRLDLDVGAGVRRQHLDDRPSCSDCWNALGPITLNAFSFVSGAIRGLPSGLPVAGATVSACSPLGNPVGVCNFDVVTSRHRTVHARDARGPVQS